MSAQTSIEWTDATWNPVTGCRKVSSGCKSYGVVHIDGSFHEPLAPLAFRAGTGAMTTFKVGKAAAGRMLDGRTHDEFPASSFDAGEHAPGR